MVVEENILKQMQEIWPDKWEKILTYFQEKDAAHQNHFPNLTPALQEKMGLDYWKKQLINRIHGAIELDKWEKEVVAKIIPKDQLEDGVVYLPLEGTGGLCRHVEEARWDAKRQVFWYIRTKFGYTFEDRMDHFADVINAGVAGFTPIKKK